MPGVYDSAEPVTRSRSPALRSIAFLFARHRRRLWSWLFRSSSTSGIPSLHVPLPNASSAALRLPSHGSGSGWFATPFLHDSFIHCFTPVYPDAIRAERPSQQGRKTGARGRGSGAGAVQRRASLAAPSARPPALPTPVFHEVSRAERPSLQTTENDAAVTPCDAPRRTWGQDGFAAPLLPDSFIPYCMPVIPAARLSTP